MCRRARTCGAGIEPHAEQVGLVSRRLKAIDEHPFVVALQMIDDQRAVVAAAQFAGAPAAGSWGPASATWKRVPRAVRLRWVQGPPEAPAGAGPLTLLVHGFPECWWTWRHVIPALAQAGHRVAAPPPRGLVTRS